MPRKTVKYVTFLLVGVISINLSVSILDKIHSQNYLMISYPDIFQNDILNVQTSGNKERSTQLIKNSNFSSQESWFYLKGGDTSDINASIHSEQAHFEILGEKKAFSLIADPPLDLNWTACDNPDYPNRPESYSITTDGCRVSHLYDDHTAITNPSIHWDRNITMPVNMSDYIITSASIKAIVYANASLDIDRAGDTEARNDLHREVDTYDVGDYVRFYVLISDLEKEKVYEIAYLQPEDLGTGDPPGGPPGEDILPNTYMTSYPEEDLIFYLSSVLNTDFNNFTLTLGMLLHFEDNIISDWDYDQFNELIINSVNLTFSYEKKIDQSTYVSWNQNLSKLSDISSYRIELVDAKLYFKYKIDQDWISSSPNTEIRIIINNLRIPEAIELIEYNYTSNFQDAKVEGFNLGQLISENENISISIQLFLADEFELDRLIKISIDDVLLELSYIEFIPAADKSILILWLLISVLLVIIGVLSALSLRSYVLIPRRTKREDFLLLRTQRFKDARNIQSIILIHKTSGIPLFSKNYSYLLKGKKTIFSGFIQAISIVGEQMAKEKSGDDMGGFQRVVELDLKHFFCLILDIEELRTVLIIKEKASKRLKTRMYHFAVSAYLQTSKRLENWDHDTSYFKKEIPPLLYKHFDLYYKDYFKISVNESDLRKIKNKYKLNNFEYRVIKNIYSLLKEDGKFKILTVVEEINEKDEDPIINAIESLLERNLIQPLTYSFN
ncbi:MAG: hypothetical protein ACFE8L_09290 [Candidatus Hodarchaeota archaeon]